MDDPALMIGFTILVWCRDSGLVPCWLLHAVSPVTLSFASAASRDATRGGIIGVYFQYKKRLFSIQHIIMYHYHDAMVQNRRGYYPIRAGARLVALLASGTGVSSAREVEPVARIDNA
jgi:hypothetical protein